MGVVINWPAIAEFLGMPDRSEEEIKNLPLPSPGRLPDSGRSKRR